jgi:endoglucanase Acf2
MADPFTVVYHFAYCYVVHSSSVKSLLITYSKKVARKHHFYFSWFLYAALPTPLLDQSLKIF